MSYPNDDDDDRRHYDEGSYEYGTWPLFGESWHPPAQTAPTLESKDYARICPHCHEGHIVLSGTRDIERSNRSWDYYTIDVYRCNICGREED